jgi:transcription initiation factor TFIID subunit 12
MSNPQAQGSQGPAQPTQAVQMLKAEDVGKLQHLSEDQRQKYRPVLAGYWSSMTTSTPGSPGHQQARAKLQEWSQKLITQERIYRARIKQQQQQQQAQQQPGQADASNSQGQAPPQPQPGNGNRNGNAQQTSPQPAQAQKPIPPTQQPPNPGQPAQQPGQPRSQPPQVEPAIIEHVQKFSYHLPLTGPHAGTPEGDQKIKDYRQSYLVALNKQQKATQRIKLISNAMEARQKAGQDIPAELMTQKNQMQQEYDGAKEFVDNFRKRQTQWKREHELRRAQQQQQQPQALGQQQPQQTPIQPQRTASQPATVKEEPQIKIEGGQPQLTPQQFATAQQQQPQQPQSQNPQIQAPPPVTQQQPLRQPPAAHSQQQQQQMNQQNQAQSFAQPQQPQQPVRPQINPAQANAHQQQQNNSPHPQSATSNAAGPPVPLSHQAAVSAAQRSYSNTEPPRTSTPMQTGGGQGNFHAPGSREREQLNNPKMPIPRTLNVSQPMPVSMGSARPTMSGPTNGAPGPMGQPVITKFPPFQLEGEGDRVLSKRKLDELVRQVTGGAEEALTPEVEEVSLHYLYLHALRCI